MAKRSRAPFKAGPGHSNHTEDHEAYRKGHARIDWRTGEQRSKDNVARMKVGRERLEDE